MSATRCTRLLVPPEAIIYKSLVVEIDFHWVVAKACLSRRKSSGKLSFIWLVFLIFWETVRSAHICFAPSHVREYVCQQHLIVLVLLKLSSSTSIALLSHPFFTYFLCCLFILCYTA